MNLFEIIAIDVGGVSPISVFAESYDLAVHQYVNWWLHHREGELPNLEVRKRNPSWPGLDVKLLADALDRNMAGVGQFDPDKGWMIYFPADEAAGALR